MNGSWPRAGGGEKRAADPKVQNSKGFQGHSRSAWPRPLWELGFVPRAKESHGRVLRSHLLRWAFGSGWPLWQVDRLVRVNWRRETNEMPGLGRETSASGT